MFKANFDSYEQYLEWCEDQVTKIYYAQIAMDNEKIKDVVAEISRRMHVTEGNQLIAWEGMNAD